MVKTNSRSHKVRAGYILHSSVQFSHRTAGHSMYCICTKTIPFMYKLENQGLNKRKNKKKTHLQGQNFKKSQNYSAIKNCLKKKKKYKCNHK